MTRYIVYYLTRKDFSQSDDYADNHFVLTEIEDESRFAEKYDAEARAKAVAQKNYPTVVLEVYGPVL